MRDPMATDAKETSILERGIQLSLWMASRRTRTSPRDIQDRFGLSRATGYCYATALSRQGFAITYDHDL